MEVKAQFKYVRITPRKLRLVVDQVRGLPVQKALDRIKLVRRGGALTIEKLIRSAISNADRVGGMNVDELYVKTVHVDAGPLIKRWLARARGSASPILKRTSHVTLILDER